MADFNLSLRMSADGKNFVGAVKLSKREIDKLGLGMVATGRKSDVLDRKLAKTTRTVQLMKTNVLGLRTAFAGLGFGLVVGQIVRAGTAMEGFVAGMTAATGSAEGAQNELRFVREEAERLGIEFEARRARLPSSRPRPGAPSSKGRVCATSSPQSLRPAG